MLAEGNKVRFFYLTSLSTKVSNTCGLETTPSRQKVTHSLAVAGVVTCNESLS